jgi:hypothetical protein
MIDALLLVWDFPLEPCKQPFCDFTQEYSRFAKWINKAHILVAPKVCRQAVQHLISKLRRGEYLVTAQVCQAR